MARIPLDLPPSMSTIICKLAYKPKKSTPNTDYHSTVEYFKQFLSP